ncbi:glycosyltransferase family 4 protein [Paraliobacillus sediminis]|uniref:glycosyltransferase family 4 protein n=1 Tax=Paraliobacillus sediminis TaxID=1885916 RepID=UPI000E3BF08F|nr:glycosyltransferase family 4 protein [Paraliobacillus sediminis]
MHIAVVSRNLIKGDGQGRVNYEVVKRSLKRGNKVTVYSSNIEKDLLEHPLFNWVRINVDKVPTALLKVQYFAIKSYLKLRQDKKSIDILLVNGFITWSKSDFNAVHFVHSEWIKSSVHPIKNKLTINSIYQFLYTFINSKLERISFKQSKVLIPVSEKVKNELIKSARVKPNSKIMTIFNGVDINEFSPYKKVVKNIETPPNQVIALFTGDIKTNRKNLDSVLKSIKDVPNLFLLIAGSTDGSPYPQMVKKMGLEEKVTFLGFKKNISELMNQADFFLFPSRYEACSLVVLEALSSGLPVVTTTQSGLAELIEDKEGSGGFIIDNPENILSITKAVTTLVNNKNIRETMSQNARRIAEKNTWSFMADTYINYFEDETENKKSMELIANES